jgi:hypothetical protein
MKTEFTIFPRGLDLLIKKLPTQRSLTIERIIEKHTLLPWLFPFMSEKNQSNIINEIKYSGGNDESYVGKLAGNKYGRCISENIRYCLCCVREDVDQYGTAYVHREHQFAFIKSCYKHKVKVITHCGECGVSLNYSAMEGSCRHGHSLQHNVDPLRDELQSNLHEDLNFIYGNNNRLTVGIVRQRFLEHLLAKGYISTDGKTRRQLLARDFLQHYSSDKLASVGLNAEYIAQRNTLERVWGDSLVINVPVLLLLIRFIGGSFEEFFNKETPYAIEIPFGHGPWPCANKFCPDYKENVIRKCIRIDNKYRGVTGKYHCTTCDSEYARDWSWKKGAKEGIRAGSASKSKKDKIMTLYLSGNFSTKEIANRLFSSEYSVKQVVKKHLLIGVEEIACAAEQINPKRDAFRIKVESVVKENHSFSRYEICLKCKTAYQWLKKNDSVWLEKRLPASKSFARFDWDEVDEALSIRVREVAKQVIESNPGTRVGVYSIMRALTKTESGRVKNYGQHLPKTQKTLQEVAETKEQYQLRHLPALVWQLRTYYGYEEVTIDTIQSYRRSYRGISEKLRNALIAKLASR